MRRFVLLASLACLGSVASAQSVRAIALGQFQYVGGSSVDNRVWLIRSQSGNDSGILDASGYRPLSMPEGAGAYEAVTLSGNGNWVGGAATFDVDTYQVQLPVIWDRSGNPRVLTTDFTFSSVVGVSDDGRRAIVSSQSNSGSAVWNNGVFSGRTGNVVGMDRAGRTVSFSRDTGSENVLQIESEGGITQYDQFRPLGGGVSGNGQYVFGQDIATGQSYRFAKGASSFTPVPLPSVPLTEVLGAPGMVSDDGALAASENGIWQDSTGYRSLAAILGPCYDGAKVTSVATDGGGFFFEWGGGDDYEYRFEAVPEPASLAVVSLGLLALRRRKAQR